MLTNLLSLSSMINVCCFRNTRLIGNFPNIIYHSIRHIKLSSMRQSMNIHSWIKAFLVGRTQSVVVDGARSKEEEVISGVPQGTILGPLLFLLHKNDLPSMVQPGTSCRLFADDCLLYRPINSGEDQPTLQRGLANLET